METLACGSPISGYMFQTNTSRSASGYGQRPQQHLVEQAEDRGVRADAQRQRQDGDEGEQRLLAQGPERVADVMHGRLDGRIPQGLRSFFTGPVRCLWLAGDRPGVQILFDLGEAGMPFKSQAQRRKFAELLVEGKISNQTFEEWNRETGSKRLPERVRKKPATRKKANTRAKARTASKR